jgi:hypothetical protein
MEIKNSIDPKVSISPPSSSLSDTHNHNQKAAEQKLEL